jgi:hypothetical protein
MWYKNKPPHNLNVDFIRNTYIRIINLELKQGDMLEVTYSNYNGLNTKTVIGFFVKFIPGRLVLKTLEKELVIDIICIDDVLILERINNFI